MKSLLLSTLAAIVCLSVILVAGAASAQTTSNGPYYANPSWDQKLQCDTPSTCPRFIVLANWNNAAVLDRETGLIWERSPLAPCTTPLFCIVLDPGTRTWFQARDRCQELTTGDRGGWRLASVQELQSLVDYGKALSGSAPRLPAGHPFIGVQTSGLYWSANTVLDTTGIRNDVAWTLDTFQGAMVIALKADSQHVLVWCVRSGSGLDPQ